MTPRKEKIEITLLYAFPSKTIDHRESAMQSRTVYNGQEEGMTLRDYFAAKAISNVEIVSINQGWEKEIARRAYLLADEMLKEREL